MDVVIRSLAIQAQSSGRHHCASHSRRPRRNSRKSSFVTLCRSIEKAGTLATRAGRSLSHENGTRPGVDAERCAAGRHFDQFARGRLGPGGWRVASRFALLVEWQAMPHVQERLLMHRFMLENGERRFRAVEQAGVRAARCRRWPAPRHAAVGFLGELPDLVTRRPPARVRGTRSAASDSCGSMPRANNVSRWAIDARLAEPALHERVEAESRQVTFVEHQRMAERNRPRVVGLVPDEIEEHLGSLAIPGVPVEERLPIECRGDRGHAFAWMVPRGQVSHPVPH